MENFIVYQAYGNVAILQEAMVSISSIMRFEPKGHFQVVVYTDKPSYLRAFLPNGIQYSDIPMDTWESWKGPRHFVHRAKIQMLLDFVNRVEGNVLYCDTDTYFLESPEAVFEKIASNHLVMHVDEGELTNTANLVFKKLGKFLRNYSTHAIPTNTHMWNAGVLGFRSTDKELLDQVLRLSDDLYEAYQKHVMEQLAFSFYFQARPRVACKSAIFHYWDFKEYRTVLSDFFKENEHQPYEVWSKKVEAILPMDLRKVGKEKKKPTFWRRLFSN